MPEWLLSDNKIQRLNETVQYALRNSAQTRTAPENDSKPSSPQTAAWLNKKTPARAHDICNLSSASIVHAFIHYQIALYRQDKYHIHILQM